MNKHDLKQIEQLLEKQAERFDSKMEQQAIEGRQQFTEIQQQFTVQAECFDRKMEQQAVEVRQQFTEIQQQFTVQEERFDRKMDDRLVRQTAEIEERLARQTTELDSRMQHHLGIFAEDIQHKLELVIEGQLLLSERLDATRTELQADIRKVDTRLTTVEARLDKKLDGVAAELAAHRADTEAHGRQGYQVRE